MLLLMIRPARPMLAEVLLADLTAAGAEVVVLGSAGLQGVSTRGRPIVNHTFRDVSAMPEVGLEPTRPCGQRILSPSRLPFRHSGS